MSKTCGTCRYWFSDTANPQDRKMLALGRKTCSLAKDAADRARFFVAETPACRKHAEDAAGYLRG